MLCYILVWRVLFVCLSEKGGCLSPPWSSGWDPASPCFMLLVPFPTSLRRLLPHRSLGVCSLPRVLLPSPSCHYINCSSEMQNFLHKPCYLITPFPYGNDMGVSVRQWYSFSLLHSIWRIQWVNVCAAQTNSIWHIVCLLWLSQESFYFELFHYI